jgi:LDH2 family malate/lactate/ureidoglycolate dehydrogenase
MMVHILGGCLSGASFSPIRVRTQRPQDPDNLGHFFFAIDPSAFRDPGEFSADLDEVIDVVHSAPAVDAARPVLVPGEPEERARKERAERGIPIPPALIKQVQGLCERANVAFVLE